MEEDKVTDSKFRWTALLGVNAIFAMSSTAMLWLLWRFPMGTLLTAAGILLVFGLVAHLSPSSDTDFVSSRRRPLTADRPVGLRHRYFG